MRIEAGAAADGVAEQMRSYASQQDAKMDELKALILQSLPQSKSQLSEVRTLPPPVVAFCFFFRPPFFPQLFLGECFVLLERQRARPFPPSAPHRPPPPPSQTP